MLLTSEMRAAARSVCNAAPIRGFRPDEHVLAFRGGPRPDLLIRDHFARHLRSTGRGALAVEVALAELEPSEVLIFVDNGNGAQLDRAAFRELASPVPSCSEVTA